MTEDITRAIDLDALQDAKALVLKAQAALDAAGPAEAAPAFGRFVAPDLRWRGMHPFDEIVGADAVAARFWIPLKTALTHIRRRTDVFFAGRNEIDGFESVWVVSMGHFMGLFDTPWLGIRPTGKLTMLRFCEFNRVADGRIVEQVLFFDIPHLMVQAGQNPFPPQTGQHLVQPGPATQDGLLFGPHKPDDGERTLALINRMIADLGSWQLGLPLEEELARTWAEDMVWWGPEGIGATQTIARYAAQHAGPFRGAFTDRKRVGHLARLAEGHYGGFYGYPSFTAVHRGGFMGMPGSDRVGEFRVIDIYRRRGDLLAENWVFIDLLHYWKGQGVDILGRTTGLTA